MRLNCCWGLLKRWWPCISPNLLSRGICVSGRWMGCIPLLCWLREDLYLTRLCQCLVREQGKLIQYVQQQVWGLYWDCGWVSESIKMCLLNTVEVICSSRYSCNRHVFVLEVYIYKYIVFVSTLYILLKWTRLLDHKSMAPLGRDCVLDVCVCVCGWVQVECCIL